MRDEEWEALAEGDVVRDASGRGWLVMGNYRSLGVVVTRVMLAMNPPEWELVSKARHAEEER